MGRTSSKGFLSLVLPGLVVLALLAVVVRGGLFRHSSGSGHSSVSVAAETASVQEQMAASIRQFDAPLTHPKTLSALRCNKTSARPSIMGDPFDRFDCYATYTSGQRQPWCVDYDASRASIVTDYEGPLACEGPAYAVLSP